MAAAVYVLCALTSIACAVLLLRGWRSRGVRLQSCRFGAITMGYVVAGLFFLRFWGETRDRLFLIFAIAFWILGIQRVALVLNRHMAETGTGLYLLRLLAFLLILVAMIDKNRAPRT